MKKMIKYTAWLMVCGLLAVGCDNKEGDGGERRSGIRASVEAAASEYASEAGHIRLYLTDLDCQVEQSYSFNDLTEFNNVALNLPVEAYRMILYANLDPEVFDVPEVGERIDTLANLPITSGAVVEKPLLRAISYVSNTASEVNLLLKNLMTRLTFNYPSPAEGTFVLTLQASRQNATSYEISCQESFAAGAPDFSVGYYLYPAMRSEVAIAGEIGTSSFSFTPTEGDAWYEVGLDYQFTIHSEPLGRSAGVVEPRYYITLNR